MLRSSILSWSHLLHTFAPRKRVIWGVVFPPPVGYSRLPSALNDPSVTKVSWIQESLVQKNLSKYCNQQVTPFIQYLVHLHRDFRKDKESTMNLVNIPSCGRRTLCPLLTCVRVSRHLWVSFCFSLQSMRGWQCLFEIRSLRQSKSIRTLLIWMKPPFALIERVFLCSQMVSVIFIRKSIPSSTKFFVSMIFNHSTTEFWISYESVMDSLEILFLASFLQLISRKVLLVSRLFYHIDVHEVFLSWWRTQGMKEGPSCNWWIVDWHLFLYAYDKHTVHCVLCSVSSNSHNSMFPTSWIICFFSGLKGLNEWFCRKSCWRACRFWWFSIFWINSRTLVLCACFTTECGSVGISEVHVRLVHHHWFMTLRHDQQWIFPFFYILCGKYVGRIRSELPHCPAMKDQ